MNLVAMKLKLHPALATLFFCSSLLHSCEENNSFPVEVDWIKANAHRPLSVDPSEVDFSDLQFLKSIIGDKRVIMLGEATHGDGTTFLAKCRLIKFLHTEMDFDIIAFESGIYECHKSWLDMKAGKNGIQSAKESVSKVWSYTPEVYPLFDYIDNSKPSLELIGIDHQFLGTNKLDFNEDLELFLQMRNSNFVNSADWIDKKQILNDLIDSGLNPNSIGSDKLLEAKEIIESLIAEVATFDQSPNTELMNDAQFWILLLKNFQVNTQFLQMVSEGNVQGYWLRDRQMADNLSWILDRYPNRKIIVWGANTHISRYIQDAKYYINSDNSYVSSAAGYIPMGEHIFEKYGNVMYSIGFTAYNGDYFDFQSFTKLTLSPQSNSIESYMNQSGEEYLFVDYKGILPNWLSQPFFSGVFAYGKVQNDWANSFDGLFYTRTMTASNYGK